MTGDSSACRKGRKLSALSSLARHARCFVPIGLLVLCSAAIFDRTNCLVASLELAFGWLRLQQTRLVSLSVRSVWIALIVFLPPSCRLADLLRPMFRTNRHSKDSARKVALNGFRNNGADQPHSGCFDREIELQRLAMIDIVKMTAVQE